MSQHIGDMGSVETLAAFERSARQFQAMYGVAPGQIAADTHPGYHIRRWAEQESGAVVHGVQHHHAHIAAVMAEHQVPPANAWWDSRSTAPVTDRTGPSGVVRC